ncbi:Glutathione S-transferase [Handroanthus impetiginosus]|uniref:Probable glutathione S-transferase n=1 Tax=Handroanthus impetiginosus TaxID=429701 RepID=A0A2G9GQX4_9LAMI|nr:Glutathione S-transferase [Handroanthus impetiginosus]
MENSQSVRLVGFWVSPYVQRVKWALKIKGIEYEYIEEDIFNRSPLLSQINPASGKVPVLVHDGKPIPESPIILEYIDEVWKHIPLLPQDPFERAQVRFWGKFLDEKVFDLGSWLVLCSEGEKQARAVNVAIEALEKVEEQLRGKSFFGGDTIGYLDLIMGFVSYLLPIWEEIAQVKIFDPLKFPGIAAWTKNFLNHEVIKAENLPSKDEMLRYFQWRREVLIPIYAS